MTRFHIQGHLSSLSKIRGNLDMHTTGTEAKLQLHKSYSTFTKEEQEAQGHNEHGLIEFRLEIGDSVIVFNVSTSEWMNMMHRNHGSIEVASADVYLNNDFDKVEETKTASVSMDEMIGPDPLHKCTNEAIALYLTKKHSNDPDGYRFTSLPNEFREARRRFQYAKTEKERNAIQCRYFVTRIIPATNVTKF